MAKYPGMPLSPDELRADLWVADIVYLPEETDLLSAAAAAGSRTMSGKSMAVFQAVKAFELLTGRRPDTTAMFGHFVSAAGQTAAMRQLT
jgi:shikimate dehydrogenase